MDRPELEITGSYSKLPTEQDSVLPGALRAHFGASLHGSNLYPCLEFKGWKEKPFGSIRFSGEFCFNTPLRPTHTV